MTTPLPKLSNRACLAIVATAIVMATSVLGARASGRDCADCHLRVVTPPTYGTVQQTVVVQPERTVSHVVPADIRTIVRPELIRPALAVERAAGPEYRTIAHRVLVSPSRKVWQVTRDAQGREVGCWVHAPAQYVVRHSHVLVRPQRTWLETAPPKYGLVPRQVTVRPAHLVHHTIPAVTRVESRTVVVDPGRDEWRPMGGHHRHHRRHRHGY